MAVGPRGIAKAINNRQSQNSVALLETAGQGIFQLVGKNQKKCTVNVRGNADYFVSSLLCQKMKKAHHPDFAPLCLPCSAHGYKSLWS